MSISYHELEIKSDEQVYDPAEDSLLAAGIVEAAVRDAHRGIDVLDMGCGTGILGLVAAISENTRSVTFADINAAAVRLCEENIERNSEFLCAKCIAIKSDMFSNIKGRFDLMIFNAPYLPDNDSIGLSESWYGGREGIEITNRFLDEAVLHLNPEGQIILVESSFGNIEALRGRIAELGFRIIKEEKKHVSFEDIVVMLISA